VNDQRDSKIGSLQINRIILMNMKDFTEYERIRQALSQSKPVTAVQYDPDIIGAIIGQAELLCRGIPGIDPPRMDGIYTTTGGVALKLSALSSTLSIFGSEKGLVL